MVMTSREMIPVTGFTEDCWPSQEAALASSCVGIIHNSQKYSLHQFLLVALTTTEQTVFSFIPSHRRIFYRAEGINNVTSWLQRGADGPNRKLQKVRDAETKSVGRIGVKGWTHRVCHTEIRSCGPETPESRRFSGRLIRSLGGSFNC